MNLGAGDLPADFVLCFFFFFFFVLSTTEVSQPDSEEEDLFLLQCAESTCKRVSLGLWILAPPVLIVNMIGSCQGTEEGS